MRKLAACIAALTLLTLPAACDAQDIRTHRTHIQNLPPVQDTSAGSISTSYTSPEMRDLAERIRSESSGALNKREIERQTQLQRIQEDLDRSISAIPKRFPGVNGRSSYANPDYEPSVQQLQADADEKKKRVESDFAEAANLIRRGEMERLRGLNSVPQSMNSQLQAKSGAVGLVKQGTSPYVHNYMNFPGKSEEDLYQRPVVPQLAPPAAKWQQPRQSQSNGQKAK
jgi:hypothetical protein